MRNICLISDGRTSHGIYKPVLDQISKSKKLNYKYILTGFHFDKNYGNTYKEIISEGYTISHKIVIKKNYNKTNFQLSLLQIYIEKLKNILIKNNVDIFLGQGDRVITLAAAITCAYLKIPFAHMHGGEKSATFDETVRHIITKFSDIHFTASLKSYKRVERLGEIKKNIFLTVSTAAEYIKYNNNLISIKIDDKYKLTNFYPFCIFLYNPDISRGKLNKSDVNTIINTIKKFNLNIIIIYPNNDTYSKDIISSLRKHKNKKTKLFKNFQFEDYIKVLSLSKFLIGNSSGGIIETPTLKIPNIITGMRQSGRETADNSILTPINTNEIKKAINKALNDKKFLSKIDKGTTPYLPLKNKKPSETIINVLTKINLNKIKEKQITF